MQKEQAIAVANKVAHLFIGATILLVTTDEKVFTEPALAAAHAVTLSAGDPIVIEVAVSELTPVVTIETVTKTANEIEAENIAAEKKSQLTLAEQKVQSLKSQILSLKNDDEITEDNTAEKLHVAELEEQLLAAEIEVESLT